MLLYGKLAFLLTVHSLSTGQGCDHSEAVQKDSIKTAYFQPVSSSDSHHHHPRTLAIKPRRANAAKRPETPETMSTITTQATGLTGSLRSRRCHLLSKGFFARHEANKLKVWLIDTSAGSAG